jgi:hypothetical protein
MADLPLKFDTNLLIVLVQVFDGVDGAVADAGVVDRGRVAVASRGNHGNVRAARVVFLLRVVGDVEVVVVHRIQILVALVGFNRFTNIVVTYIFV